MFGMGVHVACLICIIEPGTWWVSLGECLFTSSHLPVLQDNQRLVTPRPTVDNSKSNG